MQLKKDVGSHFLAASNCLRKKWKIETDNRKYMNGLGGKVSKPSIFLTNYKKASKIPVKGPKMLLSQNPELFIF